MKKILLLTILYCSFISSFSQITMTNGGASTVSSATTFYDPGGTGNYASSSNVTHKICPSTTGQYVKITFSAFATESGYDYLYVYNGSTICNSTLIGSYTGSTIPAAITSSAPDGCLTFVFTSDGSSVAAGFTASLTQQTTVGSIAYSACPANDNCSGAVTLTPGTAGGACTTISGTTSGSSQSQTGCTGTADDDVWYKFVATATSHTVTFSGITGSSTDIVHQIFSGTCGGTFTSLGCTDYPDNTTVTGLTIGNTYYVRAYTYYSGVYANFNVCVSTPPPPPTNDNCSGATSLTSSTSCAPTAGTTTNATQSQSGCIGTADDDVWYSFVATNTTHTVTVANTGGSSDIVTQAFSGSCASLSAISGTCSDVDAGQTLTGLTIGNTYYVRIYTYYSGSNSQFNICITNPAAAPANDNACGAVTLTTGAACVPIAGSTTSATQSLAACSGGTADDDVWYKFVATSTSHIINISNTGGNSNINTQVFTGTCGSLTAVSGTCSTNDAGQTLTGLTTGTTYYVRIYTNGSGNNTQFNICITDPPSTGSNACASPTKLCTDGGTLNFNAPVTGTAGGSNNYGCLGSQPGPSWFYIQMQNSGGIDIFMQGSAGDIDFALWGPYANLAAAQAACGTLPTPIDCSFSPSATETANIPSTAVAGQVYILLITNYLGAAQTFTTTQVGGTGTTDCGSVVGACDISAISLSSIGACNDNSTTGNGLDDYYTANVTVTFVNKPNTGTLDLTGTGIHSGTYSVAVGSTTSSTTHTFTGVKLKANGATLSVTAGFSAKTACTLTQTGISPVNSCSGCGTASSVDIIETTVNVCNTNVATLNYTVISGPATLSASGTGTLSTSTLSSGTSTFTYTPSNADIGTTVTIAATIADPDGAGACLGTSDIASIIVNTSATANAGSPQTVCAGEFVTLAGTIGGSATSAIWSAPSGTFGDENSLTSTYTPSITSGTVTLTLTTNGPCSAVTSTVVITVNNCCPTAVTPTNYATNTCHNTSTAVKLALAQADIVITGAGVLGTDYTIQWYPNPNYTGTVPAAFLNSGSCNPTFVPYYAKVTCLHTGEYYYGGTALITVYPAPLAPTLVKNDNTCTYSLRLNCPNIETTPFVPIGQIPGTSGAMASIHVTNAAGCNNIFSVPYPDCDACATTIVSAQPTCCDPSTNQYSVNVVVSYSNAIGGQPISVTIGGTTVTGTTPAIGTSGAIVLTISGLNSDGAIHNVSAQMGSSCVATPSSYAAPASCGSCAPTNAGTIQN